MKKLILFFILIIAIDFSYGQLYTNSLRAGVNLSTLSTDSFLRQHNYGQTTYQTEMALGFYIGASIERKLSNSGAFVIEGVLSLQGAKLDKNNKADVKITQLNMPLYYKYLFSKKISIYGGGYLGAILSSKISSSGVPYNNSKTEYIRFDNNTLDFGLLAGLSYVITEQISAEARYNLGILRLDDYYRFKNRVLQIGISYRLK